MVFEWRYHSAFTPWLLTNCVILCLHRTLQENMYWHWLSAKNIARTNEQKNCNSSFWVHLLNMWEQISLQLSQETPESPRAWKWRPSSAQDGDVPVGILPAHSWPPLPTKPTADWQPKWDINHNKLCRSSILPFLTGEKIMNKSNMKLLKLH